MMGLKQFTLGCDLLSSCGPLLVQMPNGHIRSKHVYMKFFADSVSMYYPDEKLARCQLCDVNNETFCLTYIFTSNVP